jgi:hypothetical protein
MVDMDGYPVIYLARALICDISWLKSIRTAIVQG